MQKRYFITLGVFVCLLVSLLLSARMFFSGDMMFLYDQVREMILVRDMVLDHKPILISTRSGIGGVFHGPLWLYTLVPFFILGGGNPFSFAVAYVLLTLVTVIVGYWLFTKLYNAQIGLLMAFFLAITPRIWENVKAAHGLMVIPLFYIVIFYFLILFLRGNKKMFIFATFFSGLTLQFETASSILLLALLPVVYIGNTIPSSFHKKQKLSLVLKEHSRIILLSIGAFIISIANFILFDIRHNFLMGKALLHYITTHGEHAKGYLALPERFQQHLDALFAVYTSITPINNMVITCLLVTIIIVSGITLLQKRKTAKEIIKEWQVKYAGAEKVVNDLVESGKLTVVIKSKKIHEFSFEETIITGESIFELDDSYIFAKEFRQQVENLMPPAVVIALMQTSPCMDWYSELVAVKKLLAGISKIIELDITPLAQKQIDGMEDELGMVNRQIDHIFERFEGMDDKSYNFNISYYQEDMKIQWVDNRNYRLNIAKVYLDNVVKTVSSEFSNYLKSFME
jgi:hypothetical protein